MKSTWTPTDEDLISFERILDLEAQLARDPQEHLEQLTIELKAEIETYTRNARKELLEVFLLETVAECTTSEAVRDLFVLRAEQRSLQRRYQTIERACANFNLNVLKPPYNEASIAGLENALKAQSRLRERYEVVCSANYQFKMPLPELLLPYTEEHLVQLEQRVVIAREIYAVLLDISQLGYIKKIESQHFSSKVLSELKHEYAEQNSLLKRYNQYSLEFKQIGGNPDELKQPFKEVSIARVEEELHFHRRWLDEFERIKRTMWSSEGETLSFPTVPFTEAEVQNFIAINKQKISRSVLKKRAVIGAICLCVGAIVVVICRL